MFQIAKASTPSGYPRQAAAREVRKGTKTLRQVPRPWDYLITVSEETASQTFQFCLVNSLFRTSVAVGCCIIAQIEMGAP